MEKDFFASFFALGEGGRTDDSQIITDGDYRFSVLSPRLLRVEKDKRRVFTDEKTQCVWFRDYERPEFRTEKNGALLKIVTEKTVFTFNLKTGAMASITLEDGREVTDYKKGNLKGTARTLDFTFGEIPLGDGVVSKDGVAVLDDAKSLIIEPDGAIAERRKTEKDEYYFAFGHDYRGAVRELFRLCGPVPLVPRYCLGNWWSRYKAYSQNEYTDLMQKFIDKKIPISVATVDMDWHWVDLKRFGDDGKFKFYKFTWTAPNDIITGDGWTGYSWNTELFPDYKGFLKWLKDRNFKITLNVHPAQGVRPFEDMYRDFAVKMGENPDVKRHFAFDITDKKFVEAYFEVLHKPYEEQGVDFWWIDWQQGKNTKLKNLDPLWALNHYHYLYSAGRNKRPLILSRYAEIGSHRYPLGFSGDTTISWKCLDFQPYFTANAANAGYTWWSHDIGGHHWGHKDDELYLRWVQFGLYSPIMRLHSTHNEFMGKEPWKFRSEVGEYASECLRMRHRLLPYIYSMNYRTHTEGIALCEPMYYTHSEEKGAYKYRNQYYFGSELIVAPVTEPCDKVTATAKTALWLPEGRYTDIYTGRVYKGAKEYVLHRDLSSIPVLAKAGAIIPTAVIDGSNDTSNPKEMEIFAYRGNGDFKLYEDDGETMEYEKGAFAVTKLTQRERAGSLVLTVKKPEGDTSVLPEKRRYTLTFKDVEKADKILLTRGDKTEEIKSESDFCVKISFEASYDEDITAELKNYTPLPTQDKREALIETISKFQMQNDLKLVKFGKYIDDFSKDIPASGAMRTAIKEILEME